jgi:hypothetical protein
VERVFRLQQGCATVRAGDTTRFAPARQQPLTIASEPVYNRQACVRETMRNLAGFQRALGRAEHVR